MNSKIRKIFKIPFFVLRLLRKKYSQFFYFYWPNITKILLKKVFFNRAPFCQQRTFITGLGNVYIGKSCNFGFKMGGFHFGGSIELQARLLNAKIKIGDNVATNNNIFICAANYIEIGNKCMIGQNVCIMDFEAHGIAPETRRQIGEIGHIIVGENVWIGNNVTILKNSEVGNNTIIATGAVVSGKFPANVIIGGVPAKIIKNIE